MTDLNTIESIDLTPSPLGYAHIAIVSGDAIIGDVPSDRRIPSLKLLIGVIEVAVYLGSLASSDDFDTEGDAVKAIVALKAHFAGETD
jgi:hypothetical protein